MIQCISTTLPSHHFCTAKTRSLFWSQGQFTDSTLLDVSEVELADVKFLEADPVIVVQFNCQQINCVRDKFGNVVDGGLSLAFSGAIVFEVRIDAGSVVPSLQLHGSGRLEAASIVNV